MTEKEAYTSQQLGAQLEIRIGRLTNREWGRGRVLEILASANTAAVRYVMREHILHAGIFTAGRHLVDWCWEDLKRRGVVHD